MPLIGNDYDEHPYPAERRFPESSPAVALTIILAAAFLGAVLAIMALVLWFVL